MVRDWIRQIQFIKSATSQIEMDLVTQPPFRTKTHNIPDEQQPQHQFRIDPLSCIFNVLQWHEAGPGDPGVGHGRGCTTTVGGR